MTVGKHAKPTMISKTADKLFYTAKHARPASVVSMVMTNRFIRGSDRMGTRLVFD